MIFALITSESAHSIIQVEHLKQRFWQNYEICYLLVNNNTIYLLHVVDDIIFGFNVLDYPSRTVESRSLWLFCNIGLFCLLYSQINNNKFTYDKFKSANFVFSILDVFQSGFIKIVYFLDKQPR